ncbi:MAG TPA: hypothetical protein VG096_11310 [Bryobacteraceae bacterium]|nr:hypothetical protein [Bryobacteraceae bacterium]
MDRIAVAMAGAGSFHITEKSGPSAVPRPLSAWHLRAFFGEEGLPALDLLRRCAVRPQ